LLNFLFDFCFSNDASERQLRSKRFLLPFLLVSRLKYEFILVFDDVRCLVDGLFSIP
jgi:hypothetical protein